MSKWKFIGCDFCDTITEFREKMCEHKGSDVWMDMVLFNEEGSDPSIMASFGWGSSADTEPLLSIGADINFCPKCGRALNEEKAKYWKLDRAGWAACELLEGAKLIEAEYLINEVCKQGFTREEVIDGINFRIEEGYIGSDPGPANGNKSHYLNDYHAGDRHL